MKEYTVVVSSSDETIELGYKLGELLFEGSLLTLNGELGAGKTTFTKGIAKGLGVKANVTSPTFTIMKNYYGRLPLNHIDAYRLENIRQDLGFEEYIEGDGVTVIEWANFVEYVLGDSYLKVEITINDDFTRTFKFESHGNEYQEVLEKLCIQ